MRALSLAAVATTLCLGFTAAPQVAAAAPDGSYRDTCRDMRTEGPVLTANCRGPYGWRESSIDFRRCSGDIANRDGQLVCRGRYEGGDGDWRGGGDRGDGRGDGDWRGDDHGGDRGGGYGDGGYGGGGYRGGLVLYSHTGFGGRAFPVRGGVSNLGDTGFNDRAESVRVNGGVWLLCEDRDFGGRCITVDRDTGDLWRFGMGDKISSARRVR